MRGIHVLVLRGWRAVEAQHLVSTMRLVDDEPLVQDLVERILDEGKPPLAAGSDDLPYLLSTPFRYPSPYGSRFRGPSDSGVLYAADDRRTTLAEFGYWQWRFAVDARKVGTIAATPKTVFQLGAAGSGIDLRLAPYDADRKQWTQPTHYQATQDIARSARVAGLDWIRYESVRDPDRGACLAILTPAAIRPRKLTAPLETWYLTLTASRAIWQRSGQRFVFDFEL